MADDSSASSDSVLASFSMVSRAAGKPSKAAMR